MMDEYAFSEIVRTHHREWQVAAFRITGNLSDTDDVVQDALIAAWHGRNNFHGDSNFSTFVYGIVVHKACDLVKSDAARKRRQGKWNVPAPRPRNDSLYEAIARLPTADAQMMIALLNNEMDYGKTAKQLGCPNSTLYRRVQKVKTVLKELIRTCERKN